ncbi:GLUG motif-containing protein [uncultured Parabacteroides sp.]|uniref:GLUG motif-containing protein n=1 Tax=uncultured Parabacteroides sp. TaxID=512312 RepID=UPI0025D0EC94|nr:GLUG motif-containing protein [uncultured Parabacteroides sp.]
MKTTPLPLILLLSLLLLAPTAKAEGNETTEVTKTNWQDENVLANVSVGTDGTPTDVLVTLPDASNTNRADTLYTVKTAKGLAWIANITNSKDSVYQAGGEGYLPLYPHQKGFKNCTVELDADIDLTDHYWTPIGKTLLTPFYGTFDGNHKVVKGLKIEETDINTRAGLFGRLLGNACNLGIQVATAGIKVKGQQVNVGALAGYTTSAIQNCFAIGENGAAIEAEATSNGMLGGLIGQNIGGSITNCYAALDVKGIVGNSSIAYVGGLVGHNNGNINHVYATGKIEATGQTFYMGGVVGIQFGVTLSHALAANKEGITSANTATSDFLGRVCGYVYTADIHTATCYASTKIRMNNKVTGIGEDQYGKHIDGTDADTDTDLGELFPTGDDAVWESSDGNLPILKGFTSNLQGTTAKTAVFDSPLDLSTLTANNEQTFVADSLIFSNTEGWKHKHGTSGSKAAFSGRVIGTNTSGVQLAIKTDTAAVLSFKDGTVLTGTTYSAIQICASQTAGKETDITLRSEGTVTVKSGGQNVTSIQVKESTTCRIDPKGHFLIYGGYSNYNMFSGVMQWTWDSNSAPKSDVTVNWDGGSVTIPCDENNTYKRLSTNPSGNNITVRVGKDYQKGTLNSDPSQQVKNFVSTFNFADSETRVAIIYSDMQSAADKGTADNPYVIDLATLSTDANDDGYTYTDADNRKVVTLNYTGSDSVYYSIENQAANDAHILLTSAANLATPLCLKARSGSFVDSLQVPTSANWTLKGDTLKASYVEVGGGLKLDGPVTVENTKTDGNDNYALKVLSGGSVTAGDVLKAYGAGYDAIDIENEGTLTIGGEGKVYTYGWINAINRNKLSIDKGGILRCAGFINGNEFGFPVIQWDFTNKPKTELVAKHGSEEIRFTREMFGKYLDEAQTFTANVTEDAEYTLYQVTGNGDVKLIGATQKGDIVDAFSATAGQIAAYNLVGKPTKIENEKSITITEDGEDTKYTDSKGTTHEFHGILENVTVSLLKIEAGVTMAINNVNVDSLVVKQGLSALFLNGENKLDSIAVAENGTLLLKTSSTKGLTCSKGVVNRGGFHDYTGLIRSVTIPLADGDVVFSLDTPADVEVARGGQTQLQPSGNIPSEAAIKYWWYILKNNEWEPISESMDSDDKVQTFGAGKYRCYVEVTLSNASLKSTGTTVTTLLTCYFTVTEKSTPPAPPVVIPTYYTVTLPAVEGATFSRATGETTVEEGTNFTFSIALDADYDQSVPVVTTSRGETIEPRAGDGRYVVRDIQEDVVITVTGIRRNDDPTANAAVTPDAVRLWTASGQLHISTPVAADLRIYAFDGSLLRSLRLPAGETVMEAPAGPCIVVVGDRRFKVAR